MDAFGVKLMDKEYRAADYLDQSAFDEKFEIDLKNDYIHNIFHVENKYHVPVLAGGYREMYEYSKLHLIYPGDKDYNELMDPDTMEARLRTSDTPGMIRAEFREMLVDGSYRWVQYIGIAGEENGVPEGKIYFYVFDIQNQKDRMEGRCSVMYSKDTRNALTGLRVREVFMPLAIELSRSGPGPWCCLVIDIQHFKIFNSWFGYETGDYLLSRIGQYLLNLERNEEAVAAYFGHDHFALMLRHDTDRIRAIYRDIQEIVNSYSRMVGFLPAFGVYLLEDEAQPGLDIYDKAKLAVEEAKKSYTDRIKYFDSQEYSRTRKNYELLTAFQQALTNHEITFWVQPQCSISTGKIVAVEALARWIKSDGSVSAPGAFVPFLESSGLITELDKRVWDSVCGWLRSLIDRNITPLPVSVNVSQVDLLSMDVAAYLYALTERYNIPTGLLNVEVTESAYAANFDVISRTVADLKKRGFSVLLDDFGSGYSSLNMLDKINADRLKLDMAFMKKENSLSKKGISIVESILGMANALEMPVIVEGVETEEQLAFLNHLGCRYAQGYYFYRPIGLDECERLLADGSKTEYEAFQSGATDFFHAKEFLNETLFTGSALNHILGAVAYYSLEGNDLTITRYNEPFYQAIADAKMETRKTAIQNYVVETDRPMLYAALQRAEEHTAEGGSCEVRFYKSDNSVFWFHMHFFHLKSDGNRKLFFGQVADISESREQSIRFFEVLRQQADVTMRMDLDRNMIQYITGTSTLYQIDLPSMRLDLSVRQTAEKRIESEADRAAFVDFFNPERLKETYRKAIYHEVLNIDFKLGAVAEPVEFSTYYIRHSKDQSLTVYAFAKKRERELLQKDALTGIRNRYSYNEVLRLYEEQNTVGTHMIVFSMDVNGLKVTNDTYGHLAGDELIRGAAECINRVMSPYGNCFRIGGDEFVAILYGDRALADGLENDLSRALSDWTGRLNEAVSVSCGYATTEEYPDVGITELVKFADLKMYRAKSRYYQQRGVDRRMQQAAFTALCRSYAKILKANLTEDRFEIIQADETELAPDKGYNEKLSYWLTEFARTEQVHPADREDYLKRVDITNLREFFRTGNQRFMIHYRRKIGNAFKTVMMEIMPTGEYREDHESVFLYVKNVE